MATASCPMCGTPVDWVTATTAARILGVSPPRIRQLIDAGRLPGSVKYKPPGNVPALWKVPLNAVAALIEARRES